MKPTLCLFAVLILAGWGRATEVDRASEYLKIIEVTSFEDLQRQAEAGDWVSQFGLGYLYAHGMGVPEDQVKALKWFRLAAAKGEPWVKGYLGAMYHTGKGVELDYQEAAKWLHSAAQGGDTRAQVVLSGMYVLGEGMPKDYIRGYMWLNLASAAGNGGAAVALDLLSSQMSPPQIEEAQRLSREWLEQRQSARPSCPEATDQG